MLVGPLTATGIYNPPVMHHGRCIAEPGSFDALYCPAPNATSPQKKRQARKNARQDREMGRPFWDYALGVAIAFALLGSLLVWEWSCDGGWASGFRACDIWTKGSNTYHENPN